MDRVCFLCHNKGSFNKKFVHKPAKDCGDCHNPHATDFPKLLLAESVDLCNKCHTTPGSFTHPVGKGYKDPRNGETLTCAACHDPHSANHESLLYFDRRRELCQQCHTGL